MAAMKKFQNNYHPIRSNHPPDQVVEEGLNETGSVDAKTVHFHAEDGRMHSVDEGFQACQEDRRLCFQVGDMTEANVGEYAPGTIIAMRDKGYGAGFFRCGDPFQGHFYGDTYEIKGQSGLIHEFNVDEFNEDNDGKFASYC